MITGITRDPGFALNFSRFTGITKGPGNWKPSTPPPTAIVLF